MEHNLEVAVELEGWVAHLDSILLAVALDDAELTERDGLPIPALAEFGVVAYLDYAARDVHFDFKVLGLLGSFDVPVEVIGVAHCLWLP